MNRCGNAALGKYYSTFLFPWFVTFVGYSTSFLGRHFGSGNLLVKLVQLFLLCFGPLTFVYFWGPVGTSFVVSFPKFMFWLGKLIRHPTHAFKEIKAFFLYDAVKGCSDFTSQYFGEIKRDLIALHAWSYTWCSDPAQNLGCILEPFSCFRTTSLDFFALVLTVFKPTCDDVKNRAATESTKIVPSGDRESRSNGYGTVRVAPNDL
ncbi:MAG: hypothetical protein AAGJ35_12570 [Myxococcota bacterium]